MGILITKVNSVSCVLFHVEQFPHNSWQWRWRILGDYPPEYVSWRAGVSEVPRLVFFPEVAGCVVEAQWRPVGEAAWRQAALHESATGMAFFRVSALEDVNFPDGFRAMAVVNDLVACYEFGPLGLRAGESLELAGVAEGAFVDNVLLAPGEFRSEDHRLRIENLTASEGSFVPVAGEARLALAPGAASRHVFAWTRSNITEQSPTPLPL